MLRCIFISFPIPRSTFELWNVITGCSSLQDPVSNCLAIPLHSLKLFERFIIWHFYLCIEFFCFVFGLSNLFVFLYHPSGIDWQGIGTVFADVKSWIMFLQRIKVKISSCCHVWVLRFLSILVWMQRSLNFHIWRAENFSYSSAH